MSNARNLADAETRFVNASGDTVSGNLVVDGNLGIGTSSPSTRLHTYTASGENKLTVEAGAASQSATVSLVTNATTPGQAILYMGKSGASTNGQVGYDPNNNFLYLYTNNTERLRIDSAGRVTMPYQPAFLAYTTSYGATYGSGANIVFDGTVFNIGSCYNTSNGRFTAPVAGIYHFSRNQQSYSSSNQEVHFRKNGSQVADTTSVYSAGATGNNSSIYLSLAAGDYVTVYQYVGTSNGDYNNFSGVLVG